MRLTETEKQLKLQQWATLIQEYYDSGLKLKDWLCENDLTRDQYYYWRRQLKETVVKSIAPEFVELPACQQQSAALQIAPQMMSLSAVQKPIVTIKMNNISIEVSNDASAEILSGILKAVVHA